MKFTNTENILKQVGSEVVERGRAILVEKKKTTNKNTLYNDFDYNITQDKSSIQLEWDFGNAENYWNFVDQGVKGVGGFKGSGKARGQGSDFRFGSGKYRGTWDRFKISIRKWIVNKGIQPRDKKGKFINRKSMVFLIQRSIFQRGLSRTLFFTNPYEQAVNKYESAIVQAFADDLETEIQNELK